jgi:hypothetical protein
MITRGEPLPDRPTELAFHVQVKNVPTARAAFTSQNMAGAWLSLRG